MKFYKRFPGDITIKTGDLSLVEFGAYDRLLDHYYANEQPIEPKKAYTIARCQTAADRRAVDAVLVRYWTLTASGWVQQRADEMIAEALPKIEAARENGKKGGRPSKAKLAALASLREPTGLFPETKDEPNEKTSQSQNQIDSVAIATAAGAAPGDVDKSEDDPTPPAKSPEEMAKAELWRAAVSVLQEGGCPQSQCRTFMGKLVGDYGIDIVREAVAAAVSSQPADAREYLKATCQRKKGERKDSPTVAANPQVAETRARLDAEASRDLSVDPARIAAARAIVAAVRAGSAEALQ